MIKKNYVVHIIALKHALNHGLILKKVHSVIQFNQEARLKEYIDMNTELRKQVKMSLKKGFLRTLIIVSSQNYGEHKESQRY